MARRMDWEGYRRGRSAHPGLRRREEEDRIEEETGRQCQADLERWILDRVARGGIRRAEVVSSDVWETRLAVLPVHGEPFLLRFRGWDHAARAAEAACRHAPAREKPSRGASPPRRGS